MLFKNKIKYYGRSLKDADKNLSDKQEEWLNHLRNDGYVMLDGLLNNTEIEYLKHQYKIGLEEKLDFETPCISQNLIDACRHKDMIDNKLQYPIKQLVDRGITFSQNDIASYDQVIEEFRPSTLKTYLFDDKIFFNTSSTVILLSNK